MGESRREIFSSSFTDSGGSPENEIKNDLRARDKIQDKQEGDEAVVSQTNRKMRQDGAQNPYLPLFGPL